MTCQLPDGSTVSLWASGDNYAGQWAYFWTEFDREEVPEVLYRTFRVGTPPGEWLPMKPSAAVFEESGFEEEEDEDQGAQLGAAAKLTEGRYILQAKVFIDGVATELAGVTFEVQPPAPEECTRPSVSTPYVQFKPWLHEPSIPQNDAAPATVTPNSKGWVTCPSCGWGFKPTDPNAWNGDRHRRCGQRLRIQEPGTAEPGAAPNGGPATPLGNSGVTEGPPSVSLIVRRQQTPH